MKPKSMLLLWVGILCAWSAGLNAQVQPSTTTSAVTTSGSKETPAQARLVSSFTTFAGSEENARSLVTGLRQGSEITLTPSSGPGGGSTGTTFTSPTRPMGYGNVRIALSLAREQLAQEGITQPTPAQIQTALVGTQPGSTGTSNSTSPGILQMRADGMGWGQIANTLGVKLGHVMSGKTSVPPATTAAPAPSGSTSTGTSAGTGITTAAGSNSATVTTRSRGNSAAAQATNESRSGIVTAAGSGSVTTGLGAGARSGGNAAASGVVTAAGASSGGQAAAQGRGLAKGHTNP